ncbi:MAG TPA: hypothetical protein ENI98_10605 [Gammaproteobacteria bacterium]|nr:hypothetical protein [Gammaproteobacteria bacterium]
MGLFKSMFGGGDSPPPSAKIESPKDLNPGDMLKMEFSDQTLVSGKTLKVTEQLFYDLSAVEKCKTVSIMEGADQRVLLSTSTVNPERPLELAVAILPETVFKIFKRKKFIAIFEEPDNTDHRISRKISADELNEWQGFVGESYFQERTNEAYRSKKDCRKETVLDSDWSAFDYKLMVSDDRQHAVRIEVFDGGRTDVYLIAYLALNKIEEYWPA